jgi:predicted acylesterase/phospholipase RssA
MTTVISKENGEPAASGPMRLQVVFQGGGAKLCHLMAVVKVLKEYETQGLIQITRAAGSSAGAIAAVMLASNKSCDQYRADIQLAAQAHASVLSPTPILAKLRIVFGRSYFGKKFQLESFFVDLFRDAADLKVEAFRFPLELYYTDISSLESRVAPGGDRIRQALAKSCRFPFAFVGYSSDVTEIDGGLGSNLPVDKLHADQVEYGRVIAVSFSGGSSAPSHGLVAYAEKLVSAAVQSGVNRSVAILGAENVFSVPTDIGTFDFARALKEGLDVHFNLTAARFKTWLDEWIVKENSGRPADTPPVQVRPTIAPFKLPLAIIRGLNSTDLAARANARRIVTIETANFDSKGEFDGTYNSRLVSTFSLISPIDVIPTTFQVGRHTSFDATAFRCWGIDNIGQPLRFSTHVEEMPSDDEANRTFRLYYLFDETLKPDHPNQPLTVGFAGKVGDPYPKVGTAPEVASFFRRNGPAEEVVVGVAFPKSRFRGTPTVVDAITVPAESLTRYGLTVDSDEVLMASEEVQVNELIDAMRLETTPDKYFIAGRRAVGLTPGQGFGFVVT